MKFQIAVNPMEIGSWIECMVSKIKVAKWLLYLSPAFSKQHRLSTATASTTADF